MLKQLRSKKTMKRIMKITLILVIPSFIVLYGWSSMSRSTHGGGWYYVKIKERPLQILRWSRISEGEMKEAKQTLLRDYQALLGIQNREMLAQVEKLITPSALATQAINNHILISLAEEKGLVATVSELKSYIERIYPQNPQMALQYLMNAQGYRNEENFIRDQIHRMTIQKARFLFGSRAKASLFELWQEYKLMNENVHIGYVLFKGKEYIDDIELAEKDVADYFQENKEDYRIPDQVKYEFVAVKRSELVQIAEATEEEISNYYEENKESEFKVIRQVKPRQIMLSFSPDTPEEEMKRLEDMVDDLYTSITIYGADFADLADRFSDDEDNIRPLYDDQGRPTGETEKRGGLFPSFWSKNDLDKSKYGRTVIEKALAMEEGDIIEPFKGEKGFHIIKIEEVRPERIVPLEDARDRIEFKVKNKKAQATFDEMRKKLYQVYEKTTTLSGIAKEMGVPLEETGLVDRNATFIPELGGLSRFAELLVNLREGEVSDLLETPSLLVVLRIKQLAPSHIPSLQEVKEKVDKDATMAGGLELAENDARAFLEQVDSFETMKKLAGEKEYTIQTPEPFTHTEPPAEIRNLKNLAQTTIRTREGAIKMSPILKKGGDQEDLLGYGVWCMIEKIPPDKKKFREDLANLQRDYIQGKQKTIIQENLVDLREDLRFEVNPRFLGIE